MSTPDFRVIASDKGTGITYTCGCPCVPVAVPGAAGEAGEAGEAGFEHCCCGKVHFVGKNASGALATYLADRKAKRKREPDYTTGASTIAMPAGTVEVAWAFPIEA